MENTSSATTTAVTLPGRRLVGYVHPDGVTWLQSNQNSCSSIQLLGAPKDVTDVAVYVDVEDQTATPSVDEIDALELHPSDLRLETWRPNRGGWCTKPDNCCRLTHVPSGITVTVTGDDNARSIHAAKATAFVRLKEELLRRRPAHAPLPVPDEKREQRTIETAQRQLKDMLSSRPKSFIELESSQVYREWMYLLTSSSTTRRESQEITACLRELIAACAAA